MRKIVSRLLLVGCCLIGNNILFAQGNGQGVTDVMLSNGKMYVVVAVCLTILIGLFIYVFMVDRKVTRLEKGKD